MATGMEVVQLGRQKKVAVFWVDLQFMQKVDNKLNLACF